jgi:hypothetical protein
MIVIQQARASAKEPDGMQLVYDSSFGDMSSIMIRPDQIYNNNFNLLDDDDENSPKKKK